MKTTKMLWVVGLLIAIGCGREVEKEGTQVERGFVKTVSKANSTASISFDDVTGKLNINGTDKHDRVLLSQTSNGMLAVSLSVYDSPSYSNESKVGNTISLTLNINQLKKIVVALHEGINAYPAFMNPSRLPNRIDMVFQGEKSSISYIDGVLTMNGSNQMDILGVYTSPLGVIAKGSVMYVNGRERQSVEGIAMVVPNPARDLRVVKIFGNNGGDTISLRTGTFHTSNIIDAGDGNDNVTVFNSSYIYGGKGEDYLVGSSEQDVFCDTVGNNTFTKGPGDSVNSALCN